MSCPACQSHAADPLSGLYVATCRACSIRSLAAGVHFFESMRAGRLLPEYRAALQQLGDDVQAVHAEVKAAAKRMEKGAVPA